MEDDDYSIFYGFGMIHDLSPAPEPKLRLAGLKSVSEAAAHALSYRRPAPKCKQSFGFRRK